MNRFAPMPNVYPFVLPEDSVDSHINVGAHLSTNAKPQIELAAPVLSMISMIDIAQEIQKEIIELINSVSEKLA